MKTLVIVNPAARQGKSGARWGQVQAKLQDFKISHDVKFTTAPKVATEIAKQALNDGYQRLVSVGGDGTVNEVLNGMLQSGALTHPDAVLAPIPAGTANEICRSNGLLETAEKPYEAIANGMKKELDVQLVDCTGLDGQNNRTHSALATSFGAAALISQKTSASKYVKKLGAELSYYIVALQVTLTYRPTMLRVQIDDGETEDRLIHSSLICNMRYTGGGMDMAPMAVPDDGIGDMIEFGDFGRMDLILKPKSWLFEGRHIDDPAVSVLQGRKFHVSGRDDILVDSDGETVGRLPLTVETIKQAFRINI